MVDIKRKIFGIFSDSHDAGLTKPDGAADAVTNCGISAVMSDIFSRANVTRNDLTGIDGVIMAGDIIYIPGNGNGGMRAIDRMA